MIDVAKYHKELLKKKREAELKRRFKITKALRIQKLEFEGEKYVFKPLVSEAALSIEGEEMHHCVANYTKYCRVGVCTMYSLSKVIDGNQKKLLTIQVSNNYRYKVIIEALGVCNRRANERELEVIMIWSKLKENRYYLEVA